MSAHSRRVNLQREPMIGPLYEGYLGDVTSRLVAAIIGLAVMQLIVMIFKRSHKHKTFERMQVLGPKPHFIHGHLYDTRGNVPYVKFAHKMHELYGKNVGIYLGGDPYLMTKDLDLIQQVFVAKSRIFYDRMNFYLNIDPVPDNLICQRGDRWRYMRKLLTPAFSNSKIKSSHFYHDTQQTIGKFMKQLEENSRPCLDENGIECRETLVEDSYDRMAAVALDVIVKTAFHMDNVISFSGSVCSNSNNLTSQKYGKPNKQMLDVQMKRNAHKQQDAFLNTVKRACRLGFNPLVELIFCFPFLDKPLTFLCNRLYFGSILQLLLNRLDYLVRRSKYPASEPAGPEVEARKAQQVIGLNDRLPPTPANGNITKNQVQRRRIIDSLIEVLREKRITRSEFTGNAFVIVFAGFETTANALTFTLWLLARNQRVQMKLRDELRRQMRDSADAPIQDNNNDNDNNNNDDDDYEKKKELWLAEIAISCEYLEMVLNESLRLYPPVPGLSCRQAAIECTLSNGMRIEKGVNIIPSVFSIHRDKSIWGDEAHLFKPERFEVLDVAQLNSAMFMPFGLGPRNCIGKAAAMHEMKIAIGRLVLDYSIQTWPGKTPEKLKLCSPINITITNADRIGLRFLKL